MAIGTSVLALFNCIVMISLAAVLFVRAYAVWGLKRSIMWQLIIFYLVSAIPLIWDESRLNFGGYDDFQAALGSSAYATARYISGVRGTSVHTLQICIF